MKIMDMYKKTAALFFLMVAILAPVQEAWGQVTGDQYETISEAISDDFLLWS